MPLNGFTVGRDLALNVQTPNGALSLTGLTKFTAKPDNKDQKLTLMSGRTVHLVFPDGWSGSFEVERIDSTFDDFFAAQEANYYAGLDLLPSTITETITEASGAVSQYQFVGVIFKLDDAGDWAGDATVKQKLSFVAEQRIKL
jgi:hypothetical protein